MAAFKELSHMLWWHKGGQPSKLDCFLAGRTHETISKHCSRSRKQEEIANSTKVTNKEFAFHDGPFVKEAFQSFNIHSQQYFGVAFVSNHIQKTLSVCNNMVEVARMKCPTLVASETDE